MRSDLSDEVWKPHPDQPKCLISNLGRVTTYKGEIRQLHKNKAGYYVVVVYLGLKKSSTKSLHRLVCILFNGPPPFASAEAMHKDSNKENCRADNLRWGTRSENMQDLANVQMEKRYAIRTA